MKEIILVYVLSMTAHLHSPTVVDNTDLPSSKNKNTIETNYVQPITDMVVVSGISPSFSVHKYTIAPTRWVKSKIKN